MHEFTFESLQKRVLCAISDRTIDPEARFMWDALTIITTVSGYTHLIPEEVFGHLKTGTEPEQPTTAQMVGEIRQLEKELEAKNEDPLGPDDIATSDYFGRRQ
ncbi:hypothetical protein LCGC14_3046570 [marine sediment metagenome]|uniref:Uncharacterized protein n=1 Tax=marine sediment metagenome TaxID=412755 RepID=A0A0F8XB70_9ZZZZ